MFFKRVDPFEELKKLYPQRGDEQRSLCLLAGGGKGANSPGTLKYVTTLISETDKLIDDYYSRLKKEDRPSFEFYESARQFYKSCHAGLVNEVKRRQGRLMQRDEADPTDDDTTPLLKNKGP
jgi:hypothetical protein